MKFGIVGNNDGPLYLLKGLQDSRYRPEFVGLQKPVSETLQSQYLSHLEQLNFFEGFEENILLDHLYNYELDLLINCFCNFKFEELLDQSFDVLNVHLSPLPAYRGRHPLQWALINGEEKFGITIHKMTEKYDAGEIYWQQTAPIPQGMSVQQLRTALMERLKADLAGFLTDYTNDIIHPRPNSDAEASYMSRRCPTDSRLTEWDDARKIYRKVQALRSENYAAYILINDHKITCRKAVLTKQTNRKTEKPCIKQIREKKFQVACPEGRLIWLYGDPKEISQLKKNQKLQ